MPRNTLTLRNKQHFSPESDIIVIRAVDFSNILQRIKLIMKHTLKKITASIAAAVMCAIPAANALSANAEASITARFTYRKIYYVPNAKNIDHVVFGLACNSSHTSSPSSIPIAYGSLTPGYGGGPGFYNEGGTFVPTDPNVTGRIVSQSVHCDSAADYHERSSFAYAYKANGQAINNAVYSLPTFLVGDFDGDNDIDGDDYSIINHAVNVKHISENYSVYTTTSFDLGGVYRTYKVYKFDVNNDGYVNNADVFLLDWYNKGYLTNFSN